MIASTLKVLETAYLLLQGIPKYELISVLGLGAYIPKAEKIKKLLEKNESKNNK